MNKIKLPCFDNLKMVNIKKLKKQRMSKVVNKIKYGKFKKLKGETE